MKYKLVGWADVILGGLGAVQQILMLVFVYPKLKVLYQDFGADLPWMTRNFPCLATGAIVILAGMVFPGVKLVFSKAPKEGWFVAGLVALFTILALGGVFMGMSVMSMVGPIAL